MLSLLTGIGVDRKAKIALLSSPHSTFITGARGKPLLIKHLVYDKQQLNMHNSSPIPTFVTSDK